MLDADFLFKKDSPTTIVDLSFKQVYRTPILNEFNAAKYDILYLIWWFCVVSQKISL